MQKDDWQILKSAAQKLKTLAQDLGIVVIMLAQVNESGRLAQASYMAHEADLWLNIDTPDEEGQKQIHPYNCLLKINKARNADKRKPIGLYFDGDKMRFTDDKNEAYSHYSGALAMGDEIIDSTERATKKNFKRNYSKTGR